MAEIIASETRHVSLRDLGKKLGGVWAVVGVSFVFSVSPAIGQGPALMQTVVHKKASSTARAAGGRRHGTIRTHATASDGTETGTAQFLGNATTITAPGSQVLGLAREADCSLTLLGGNYSTFNGLSYTRNVLTPKYDQVLHTEAGLTSKGGVYASGCASPKTGIGSRLGVFVGTTTSGINVFAGVEYSFMTMGQSLMVLSGSDATNYGLMMSSFPTAGTLATADLNGDGNGDLVVVNNVTTTSGSVSVLLGNADGSFKTAVSYPTAGAATATALIDDVNGDGKLDIVTASLSDSEPQEISVLLGNGDGTFSAAKSFSVPVLPGYTSNVSTPIQNLITADLRGDGKKDLIGSNGLVLLGNGDGTFTAAPTPAFPYVIDSLSLDGPYLASGDLNRDGKVDLVFDDGLNITTYFGKGDGTFTPGTSYAGIGNDGEVAITDLDGDGSPDIYTGLANGGVYEGDGYESNLAYAIMGHGDGSFVGAPTISQTSFRVYTGTNLADVNGDGLPDLITLDVSQDNEPAASFTVQLASKSGVFHKGATITLPPTVMYEGSTYQTADFQVVSYAVGDVNGDGFADVVYETEGGPSYLWVALGKGDGTFGAPTSQVLTSGGPSGLRIGDFNGDGKADLLGTFAGSGPVYQQGFMVLPGNGDGTFGAPVTTYTYNSSVAPPSLGGPTAELVADLNGDGKLDLFVVSPTGQYNSDTNARTMAQIYLGNGDGTFGGAKTVTTADSLYRPEEPDSRSSCLLVDLNKDGRLDLACVGEDANAKAEVALSLGNGDGTFAAPTFLSETGGISTNRGGIEGSLAAADFDGDGNVDLALTVDEAYAGILFGKGDGTFTSVLSNGVNYPTDLINLGVDGASVAADFNGDGKPDLLIGGTTLLNIYGASQPALTTTTTSLTASAASVTVGASVTLTAAIAGAAGSSGAPSGTVTFVDGTTTIGSGTVASGAATFATTMLGFGTHSITAVYSGDATFSGSTSDSVTVTVNAAPTLIATSVALTASPTSAVSGTSISLAAVVSAASGTTTPTGTITFADGGTTIGSVSLDDSGKASIATTALAVGTHTIAASYGGSSAFSTSVSTSQTITITSPPPADFTVSLSSASGTVPASTTLTVSPVNGFSAAVTFACSGLPSGLACSFNPTTVTPSGAPASTTVNFIQNTAARAWPDRGNDRSSIVLLALGIGSWLLVSARRRRFLFKRLAVVIFTTMLVGLGCGGGGGKKVASTTSTVTITAVSGSVSHTATYMLTVSN